MCQPQSSRSKRPLQLPNRVPGRMFMTLSDEHVFGALDAEPWETSIDLSSSF